MTTSTRGLTRWAIGAVGALTLGLLGVAAPASAEPNLDPDADASLTIHKFAEPAGGGTVHDGAALEPTAIAGLTPLNGVTFEVQQVDIDLATNEGWVEVESLIGSPPPANLDFIGATQTVITGTGDPDPENNPSGTASLSLDVGVYLVTEIDPGEHPIVRAVAPFLVTVPIPNGDNTWNYDVHVYPKNSVTSVEKTVDDGAAHVLGDTVSWTVDAEVPHLPGLETFENFVITDELDSRLGFTGATVSLDGAELTEGTEYSLGYDPASNTVTVTFTDPAGLAALDGAQGATVSVDLATTVDSIDGDGDNPETGTVHGIIQNDAIVTINDLNVTTNTVETLWGALQIVKYALEDADDTASARSYLEGAEFQIFTSEADAEDQAGALLFAGRPELTTDADGEILVEGLKAGNYWIVETQAPVGYTGVTDPIAVTITEGAVEDAAVYEVLNTQKPPFELPLTGAAGTVLFSMAGLGLIAIAVGAGLRHRSRVLRATA